MEYIVNALINIITDGLTSMMDLIGNSIISILTMNIGSGTSFFDIVFSAIGGFGTIIYAMAMTILAMNYFWQLFRLMYTQEGTGDTPLSLTFRTVAAGIFVVIGKDVIYYIQNIFATFYNGLLTMTIDGASMPLETDFSAFSNDMLSTVQGGSTGAAVDAAIGLGGALLILLLIALVAYQFVMYMIEVVERYVVLGILYYTAPLAFSLAGSKSTGNVFASWVRMIGSQMFLMVCNVLFLRLFLSGFGSFSETIVTLMTIEQYQGTSALSLSIIWCLIMYGILYVGSKVDSYLGTIGLSAAQTGRGLGASLVASGLGLTRALRSAKDTKDFISNKASNYSQKAKAAVEKRQDMHQKASYNSDGSMSASAMNARAQGKVDKKESQAFQGQALGAGFVKNADGIPSSFASKLNTSSAKQGDDGVIKMDTFADKDGKKTTISAAPMSGPNATSVEPRKTQGRELDIDGQKYFAVAQGPGAQEFLTKNPAMEEKMQAYAEREGCSARQLTDASGRQTGVWETTMKDAQGNTVESKQFAPATMFSGDAALGSQVQTVGDMAYHVSDVTAAQYGATAMGTPVLASASNEDRVSQLSGQFSALEQREDFSLGGVTPSESSPGVISYANIAGEIPVQYAMAPSASYAVASPELGSAAQLISASNGAMYVAVPLAEGSTPESAFVKRTQAEGSDGMVFAQPLVSAIDIGAQHHDFFSRQPNDIGSEAQRRNNNRK